VPILEDRVKKAYGKGVGDLAVQVVTEKAGHAADRAGS
jgi:hypothetical protein